MSDGMGYLAFYVISALALLFAVVSNILVIVLVIKERSMRINASNLLVCNLALSDLLLASFVIPSRIHDISHTESYYEGIFFCKLINFSPVLCIMCSVWSLTAISLERYRAVVQHKLKTQMTLKMCYIVMASIWIVAWIVSIPTIVEFTEIEETAEHNRTFISCGSHNLSYAFSLFNGIFLLLISYLIPLGIISRNYINIGLFLSKQGRDPNNVLRDTVVSKHRMKIVKMMVIVTVLFALSWLPYFVVQLISKITGKNGSEDSAGPLALAMISLSTFSTAYNVVLYVMYNNNFRRAFKSLLCCGRFSKVTPDDRHIHSVMPTVQS